MISIRYLVSYYRLCRPFLALNHRNSRWVHETASTYQVSVAEQSRVHEIIRSSYNDVEPKIGLEVHAQLKLNAKLFSLGGNSKNEPPNSQLDLFDISLPGTLPKLNKKALRLAILSGLGLNCTIQDTIHFDRKNYFYTDMPAGYQITQYNKPIAKDGFIDFIVTTYHRSVIAHSQNYDLTKYLYSEERYSLEDFEPYVKRSRIKQIQLEQDSAKSLHHLSEDSGLELFSLVDYNRSGSGLIEIVFEPDLTNHHEASSLIKELVKILKALDTCDCELEEGSFRVDANVSINKISGQQIVNSGKVELKNLNSIRSINRGVSYEIDRQAKLIREGKIVTQESRTYDTKSNQTVPLRVKEDAVDYRYIPDPNIPPLRIDKDTVEEVRGDLPKDLPCDLRSYLLSEYKLDLILTAELLEETGLSGYMLKIMRTKSSYNAGVVADFLIYTMANLKRITNSPIEVDFNDDSKFMQRLGVDNMQTILDMIMNEEISFMIGYEVIKQIFVTEERSDPRKIVRALDSYQINDPAKVAELCAQTIGSMKSMSQRYSKRGEKKHLRVLLDNICNSTGNKINVKKAIQSFNDQLRP